MFSSDNRITKEMIMDTPHWKKNQVCAGATRAIVCGLDVLCPIAAIFSKQYGVQEDIAEELTKAEITHSNYSKGFIQGWDRIRYAYAGLNTEYDEGFVDGTIARDSLWPDSDCTNQFNSLVVTKLTKR